MALAGGALAACGDPSHKEASGEEGYPSRLVLAMVSTLRLAMVKQA
ncbi:hypothetical protein CPTB_01232 [Corynebacterium pseudotuberculosis]|nr:hypothetical protein CPTA_00298 [Corynebacterium pseudotuberculosis]AIG09288.1 hypothetical protein CPTB_01232 [Corynebacterium pseudotuberculosis]AIG11187.1 hypothetical protein CPTC_00899 [Corynebacterium pseudotuberculosis]